MLPVFCIFIMFVGITLGELLMKRKIRKQIDAGLSCGMIKMELMGNDVQKMDHVYKVICAPGFIASCKAHSSEHVVKTGSPFDPPV